VMSIAALNPSYAPSDELQTRDRSFCPWFFPKRRPCGLPSRFCPLHKPLHEVPGDASQPRQLLASQFGCPRLDCIQEIMRENTRRRDDDEFNDE